LLANIHAAQIATVQQFFIIALVLKESGEPNRTVAIRKCRSAPRHCHFHAGKKFNRRTHALHAIT
jgi:hypothetical protein